MTKIVSRNRMGYFSLMFHWFMILCTCGLWYPIYASIRRSRSTVTYMPTGGIPVAVQPPQQPYPPQAYPPPPYGQQPPQQWAPPRR
jgi:hypothetical protein